MSSKLVVIVADDTPLGTLMAVAGATGEQAQAVVVGSRERAEAVAAAGVASVTWFAEAEGRPCEALAQAAAAAVAAAEPSLVLAANAPCARVIAGAAAARLQAGVTAGVVTASLEGDRVLLERLVAEQRAVETVEAPAPIVALVADGSDDVVVCEPAPIEEVTPDDLAPLAIIATHEGEAGGVELASADRVVGVGRGLTSKDQLSLAEDLAEALGAEIACSLSLCDDYRWFEHSRVVGTSTQRIAPRLYVSLGISGQPQHMTGVRGAKTIVAVNNDPEAPIFRNCAYGVIGDLNKVAPALAAALRR